MRPIHSILILLVAALLVCGPAAPAGAQFDKLKKKAKDKVEKKADEKTDDAVDKATGDAPKKADAPDGNQPAEAPEAGGEAAAAGSGGSTATDMALYKKYDFIPGDRVLFYDDLSREEMGEFPSRWNLERGVFEIAQYGPDKWIACTDKGTIFPRITAGPLPDKYTVELEFYEYGEPDRGHWLHIQWVDAGGKVLGWFRFGDHFQNVLHLHDNDIATKTFSAPISRGVHTMRIMATKSTIKCYLDSERVANVPQVEEFNPVGFRVYADLYNEDLEKYPLMFRNFRFAEGGKTLREQLDEAGRIVTHGILFDSGSATIRAESYKTLADIAGLLTGDAALRLSIEGHTDSEGADTANQTLSEARAASVRDYLASSFQIPAERMAAKGYGESKPIDTNDTPEGKANNRRVELVKL